MAFDYCTLPADDERSIRPFELAPVGCRRFTKSSGDFIPRGIMTLSRGCVVSAPLPGLSPCCSGSPLSHGEGTFLSRHGRTRAYRQPSAFSWQVDTIGGSCTKGFLGRGPAILPCLARRLSSLRRFLRSCQRRQICRALPSYPLPRSSHRVQLKPSSRSCSCPRQCRVYGTPG